MALGVQVWEICGGAMHLLQAAKQSAKIKILLFLFLIWKYIKQSPN